MQIFIKAIFYFSLTVFGVGLADMAMDLQRETIKAYQKGSISAGRFTRMMIGEPRK